MELLRKRPRVSTPTARELRECWVFTAGNAPGVVDAKLTRAWPIMQGEEISPVEMESLSMEIHQHFREARGSGRVRWARLEWSGFESMPLRSIFGGKERVG